MFEKIKQWYDQGLWSIEMVKNAVKKNIITTENYIDITNHLYLEDDE